MSHNLATNDQHMREFQEKVIAKLRADIGELLPDAALAGLVERAVEEQFFKPMPPVLNYYNQQVRPEQPSWFVQEVAKIAEPQIRECVANWLTEHKSEIEDAVTKFLEGQNLLLLTLAAMRNHTHQDIAQIAEAVVTRMRQNY